MPPPMFAFALLIVLSLLASGSQGSPSSLAIKWLSKNDHVVCNDGSQAGYYVSLSKSSSASSKNKWIIHLQGGGQCYSKQTCDDRMRDAPQLMSSKTWASSVSVGGLFDNESSKSVDYFDANKVYIPYCSSDGWMGDAEASAVTFGYEFRGQRIIKATILDLVKSGLVTYDSRILFGGSSAGARGAMTIVDSLPALLPAGALNLAGVFLDSPYYVDIQPYTSNFVGFQNQTKEIYNRYNVDDVISSECNDAFPLPDDKWKCLYGQYRMPFLKTPYLLIASSFDSYQLSNNLGASPPYPNSDMYAYAQRFAEFTKSQLNTLFTMPSNYNNNNNNINNNNNNNIISSSSNQILKTILSWSCYTHAVSLSDKFYKATCNSLSEFVSLNNATSYLVNNVPASDRLWIDNCVSTKAGQACGGSC